MTTNSSALLSGDESAAVALDVEVEAAAPPVRRTLTAKYQARVVAEYETEPRGEKGGVLRREGLSQSELREWMSVRDAVAPSGDVPRRLHRAGALIGRAKSTETA